MSFINAFINAGGKFSTKFENENDVIKIPKIYRYK